MSKERELLRKISRKTHCINYDEIEELLAQPEQTEPDYEDGPEFEGWEKRTGAQEPMTGQEISQGFRADKDATNAESYWAGVALAEKHYGVKRNETI